MLCKSKLRWRFRKFCGLLRVYELYFFPAGLKDEIATHYKRERHLEKTFQFVEPIKIEVKDKNDVVYFYYYLPIRKTLKRLLSDNSLRPYIIHMPIFSNQTGGKKIYKSFADGRILQEMALSGPYMIGRIYLDSFNSNCAIGSSSSKHKIMGKPKPDK